MKRLWISRASCPSISCTVAGEGLERRQLLLQRLPVAENLPDQAADLLRQQAEPRLGLEAARAESGRIGRPGLDQAGAREAQVDQLPPQFIERAERHELHRHLVEPRQVLLEILELFAKLQHEQSQQPRCGAPARLFGRIEDAQRDAVAVVDQTG
jgi:hypothetical protein